jgi:periplasmic protein TonB
MSNYRPIQIVYLLLVALLCMCKRGVLPENPSVSSPPIVSGEVYTVVDQPPAFPGGQVSLGQYLMKSMRYPADAQRARLQGQVIISFIVTSTGQIIDAKIKQSVGGSCDTEALRIVKEMPNWTPGQLNGKPVNVLTNLPLNFKLI